MTRSRIRLSAALAIVCALFTTAVLGQSLIPGRTASGNQQSILPTSAAAKGQQSLLGTTAPEGYEDIPVSIEGTHSCGCAAGTPEGEANCGLPTDNTNGGCNSSPEVFGTVSCGETICGTVGSQVIKTALRDTDWYELVLGSPTMVTVQVTMETEVLTGNVLGVCASPALDQLDTQPACSTASYSFDGVAGTNTIFVAGNQFSGYSCGTPYTLTVTCSDPLEADLELVKTNDADGPLNPGDLLTYTLTVTNNGPDDATGVVVQDDLPPSTTYEGDTCGAGPPAGNTLTWNVGNLSNGNSASCDVTVRVLEPGQLVNFAMVSSNESDPDFANNEDESEIEVAKLTIPTLNQIGLVLLVSALGLGGFLVLRRRIGA